MGKKLLGSTAHYGTCNCIVLHQDFQIPQSHNHHTAKQNREAKKTKEIKLKERKTKGTNETTSK